LDNDSGLPLGDHWREWTEQALRHTPAGWTELVDELTALQDTVATSGPPPETVAAVTGLLARARELLGEHATGYERQIFGRLLHLPGRGQSLTPPLHVISWTGEELLGETVFGAFHSGSNQVAHGGSVALFLDEALGRVADLGEHVRSRTASLRVDYRNLTPIGRTLQVRVTVGETSGRKRNLHAVLTDGPDICAQAHGLFIELRPGQR